MLTDQKSEADMRLKIIRATVNEIPIIEDVLYNVTDHFESIGDIQWLKKDVTWEGLSRYFRAEDFYISYLEQTPIGCMAILDYDPVFWPDLEKGASLFIHKLAIKREYSKQGFAREMIDFVKRKAVDEMIYAVHLDCHSSKEKLRKLYEQEQFKLVGEGSPHDDYYAAFYEWTYVEDNHE